MSLMEQIKKDRITAMKEKDTVRLSMIRMLLATFDTEKGKTGKELSEEQIISLITRNRNNLNEEIKSLEDGGRDASVQKEQLEVVMTYLPEQMTEEEIRKAVDATIFTQQSFGRGFGDVMKVLSIHLKGKADMKLVSKIAKEMYSK